jgi:hypothetical protein
VIKAHEAQVIRAVERARTSLSSTAVVTGASAIVGELLNALAGIPLLAGAVPGTTGGCAAMACDSERRQSMRWMTAGLTVKTSQAARQ